MTQAELKRLLNYDPVTGVFTWAYPRQAIKVGMAAGTKHKQGYVQIRIDGKAYYAHRLAWLYMTGSWPPNQLDHINLDKADNSFSNLRLATNGQNQANKPRQRNNTSGVTGVEWTKSRQRWQVGVGDRCVGYYRTFDEAVEARTEVARLHFGSFARLG